MALFPEPGGGNMRRWLHSFTWSGHSVGMLAFLALFPGFFFYHSLLGRGMNGAERGGYFAPRSRLFSPPRAGFYAYLTRRRAWQLGRPEVFFLLYVAYFLTVIAVQAGVGASRVIIGNHLLGVLFIVNMFLMFRLTDFSSRAFRFICLASIAAMSAIVFAYSVDGSFYLAPLGTAKNPESLATYQGFSRSYLVTFVVAVCFSRALPLRILLYCVAAPTLFVNTARSEFVAMLFTVPIIELYYSRRKVLMAAVLGVLCLGVYMYLDQLLALLPSNRILELLDLSQSTSANKRHHLTMYAMNTIAQFPVFGDYASYNPGFYSHNVLSAWVDTGLFGFLFVLANHLLPIKQNHVSGYMLPQQNGKLKQALTFACSTLMLLATSHYFTDMAIGAALGSYSRYRYGRKHGPHRSPDLGPSAPRHPHLHQAVPTAGAARV
jgi:hypothetical protein